MFYLSEKKMDNKGSTLVEIIVSVLIIGIVFVPLLMGLTNAIKTNTRAEKNLNAESAAVNCMETVKAMGKSGMEALVPTIGSEVSFTAFSSTAQLKRDSANVYTISGINEGANTYYAQVSFSEEEYKNPTPTGPDPVTTTPEPKQNDILYTEFTSITGDGTRPEKITIPQAIDTGKLEVLRAQSGIEAGTVAIPDTTDMRSLVKTKQTVIVVDKYPATHDEYPGKYYIQVYVNYILDNTNDSGQYYFEPDADEYKYSSPPSSPQICQSDAAGGPNTLLIFYAALKDLSSCAGSANAVTINNGGQKEMIVFRKLIDNEIKLYTFVSNVDVTNSANYSASKMYFNVQNDSSTKNASGDVQIYCSLPVESAASLTSKEIEILGTNYSTTSNNAFSTITEITEEREGKKMYDVTVDVKDTNDVLSATKTSTIIE